MENKELEDAITKALINGDLIPAAELGMNMNDFSVNTDYWYTEMYEMYKDSCHFVDSLDDKQSSENCIDVGSCDENHFACTGNVGYFQWYALSVYFDENVHEISDKMRNYNKQHDSSAADDILGPGEYLSKAINNDGDLVNYLRNPFVVNMSESYSEPNMGLNHMKTHLRNFLEIDLFPENEVLINDEDRVSFNRDVIKGKDVIIPMIYATTSSLEMFGKYAKIIADLGANTVVGIFATRIAPTIDGREGRIPANHKVASFAPRFRLNLGSLLK